MGCEFHTSDNGDLDGFWQLSAVDTLATGGTADVRAEQWSWSVQGHLLEIRRSKVVPYDVLFRFRHTADSLIISEPYVSNRDSGDIKIVDAALLEDFGIYHTEEHFRVLNLNGSRMSLQSDRLRLYFRRY